MVELYKIIMTADIKSRCFENKLSRGFTGIALLYPKFEANVGMVMRTSAIFNVDFIYIIGPIRYKHMRTDTLKCSRHVPIIHFPDFDDFWKHIPNNTDVIGVELSERSKPIQNWVHRPRSLFLFGPEDGSIPTKELERCIGKIQLPGYPSLNLSTAVAVTLYDKILKENQNASSHALSS